MTYYSDVSPRPPLQRMLNSSWNCLSNTTPPSSSDISKQLSNTYPALYNDQAMSTSNKSPATARRFTCSQNNYPETNNPAPDSRHIVIENSKQKNKQNPTNKTLQETNSNISSNEARKPDEKKSDCSQSHSINKTDTDDRKHDKLSQLTEHINPWHILLIFSLVVIVIAFKMNQSTTIDTISMSNDEKMIQKVTELFSKLKVDFPHQKVDTWKKLQVAVKALFRNTTTQPSVVILFANVGAEDTTKYFSRVVAEKIESLFEDKLAYIHEQGKLIQKEDGGKLKEHFESVATQGFNNGSHVFLLENLNLIPSESVMMFHGLCDDQMAPFKKVVYLMTVDIADLSYVNKKYDLDVNSINIAKVWSKDIKIDQRGSLESRIGGIKVLIHPENV